MDTLTLDCGCGTRPKGDVNVDVVKRVAPNFVRCDIQWLPFRDEVFTRTFCLCVLEHLHKPYTALKEISRITNGEVTVRYDCFLSVYNFLGRGHKNMMVKERFVRLPSFFFRFWNMVFTFRPLKFLCRKAGLFRAQTYERTYRTEGLL